MKNKKRMLTEEEIKAIRKWNRQYTWERVKEIAAKPSLVIAIVLASLGAINIVGGMITMIHGLFF